MQREQEGDDAGTARSCTGCRHRRRSVRALVAQRFVEIAQDEPYDPDTYGYLVAAEPGDSVEAREKETGCPILGNLFT